MSSETKKSKGSYTVILRDNVLGLTKPAIRRLAIIANVKRVKGSVYDTIRIYISDIMTKVLEGACIRMRHMKRKTIKPSDVKESIRLKLGDKIYYPCDFRIKRKIPKTIYKYGKNKWIVRVEYSHIINNAQFAVTSFRRYVKELIQNYCISVMSQDQNEPDIPKVCKMTFFIIQAYVEHNIISILRKANILCEAMNKVTLTSEHIHTALLVSK